MIWQEAARNCFVTYRTIRRHNVKTDGPLKHRRDRMRKIRHIELCNRRWVKLLCACRLSHDIAMNVDRERRENEWGRRYYWDHGRTWERRLKRRQKENKWDGLERLDDQLEAKMDADVRPL